MVIAEQYDSNPGFPVQHRAGPGSKKAPHDAAPASVRETAMEVKDNDDGPAARGVNLRQRSDRVTTRRLGPMRIRAVAHGSLQDPSQRSTAAFAKYCSL